MRLFIAKPDDFDFKTTVYCHGWCELKPFSFDETTWSFSYAFQDIGLKNPLAATISPTDKKIRVDLDRKSIGAKTKQNVIAAVRHMLRLDEDFGEFYRLARRSKEYSWIPAKKAGRMVRSPSVWEDLVKTICTTNCSWGLTKSMVSNLVEKIGSEGPDGTRGFPTPESMAELDEAFYRDEIRAGYRSPYFVELAQDVAGGKLDPESWLTSELPTSDLKKELKRVKGVGDYAADTLLKLLGRYDGLALDSFLRTGFVKKHNKGRSCKDRKIEKFYANFGEWRGLAIWLDMTREYLEDLP